MRKLIRRTVTVLAIVCAFWAGSLYGSGGYTSVSADLANIPAALAQSFRSGIDQITNVSQAREYVLQNLPKLEQYAADAFQAAKPSLDAAAKYISDTLSGEHVQLLRSFVAEWLEKLQDLFP